LLAFGTTFGGIFFRIIFKKFSKIFIILKYYYVKFYVKDFQMYVIVKIFEIFLALK
jgi:hypothetical protein